MKIVFSPSAEVDLAEIVEYLTAEYPALVDSVRRRIEITLKNLAAWPEIHRTVTQRSSVRVVPLVRYPYRIFYRVTPDTIEIVRIYHTSRRPLDDEL